MAGIEARRLSASRHHPPGVSLRIRIRTGAN